MTCDDIIKFAKEQYGRDLTEEQARAVLQKLDETATASGELSDDALAGVSGGSRIMSQLKDLIGNLGKFF